MPPLALCRWRGPECSEPRGVVLVLGKKLARLSAGEIHFRDARYRFFEKLPESISDFQAILAKIGAEEVAEKDCVVRMRRNCAHNVPILLIHVSAVVRQAEIHAWQVGAFRKSFLFEHGDEFISLDYRDIEVLHGFSERSDKI